MESRVARELAVVLGVENPAVLDPRKGFLELGLDSLTGVELKRRLEKLLDLDLPATLIFDQPSIEKSSRWLLEQIAPQLATGGPEVRTRAGHAHEDIAIVELACVYLAVQPTSRVFGR